MVFDLWKYCSKKMLIGIILLIPILAFAQTQKKTRILFLLDASSSMTYPWNPANTRFEVASSMVLQIIDSIYSINNEVEFAVRAYGTIYPAQEKNCTDTRLEVPFNVQNVDQIKTRLKYITPRGFSPIAYSIQQASENELANALEYDYSIILINDGGESCNGDVCKTFKDFLEKRIKVKPYVIGLDKNNVLKSYYDCVGNYVEVTKADDIPKAVAMIVDANRSILTKPKQFHFTTTYSNTPKIKDSVVPATVPVLPVVPVVPVVKKDSTPVMVVLRKELIPFTSIPYMAMAKQKIVFKTKEIKKNKYKSVSLHFTVDEPIKVIPVPVPTKPLVRETIVVQKLNMGNPFLLKTKINLKKPVAIVAKKQKVNLHFEVEKTRINFVFPYLVMNNFSPNKKSSNSIKGKTISYKSKKVDLHFDTEKPRVNFVFPYLVMQEMPINKKVISIAKGKSISLKKQKVDLHFEIEKPRVNFVFPYLKMEEMKAMKKSTALLAKGKSATLKKQNATLRFNWEVPKKPSLVSIKADKYPLRYSYAFKLPQANPMAKNTKKAVLRFAVDVPPPPPIAGKDLEFNIETENSAETQVQVYFKNVNGNTYPKAKPEIQFKIPGTNQLVTSFKRIVNGTEPVPQPIPPGTYNLVVAGFNDLFADGILITANKINRVYLKVTDGTLSFGYTTNKTRVMKYKAVVNRRFDGGSSPTVIQNTAEVKYYEPGNYYVEINTLPAQKFSIDLVFGARYEIQIQEPGSLQISNTNKLGKIQLQCVLGDQFLNFYNLNVTGNLSEQKLELMPGPYKAIVPVNPSIPEAGTKVINFRVDSNKETVLELK